MTELPLTVNGKVDCKNLPKPASILIAPQTNTHENLLTQIRQLFANVLSLPLEVIDNHVIFGDLGGDSMQMAYMINEMLTKMIAPEHHVAFANRLEQLLICPTPHNFYEYLSKII